MSGTGQRLRPGFGGPPVIMGILNVTDDSFSDGGMYSESEAALRHTGQMLRQGAAVIDIGAESSRPGSRPVPEEEQLRRIIPVLHGIRSKFPDNTTISVDTRSAAVAAAALAAGADWINDISAGRDDPDMLSLVASRQASVVLMHMQGTPADMQDNPDYKDVFSEVQDFLRQRVAVARAAGIAAVDIIIDPGIGFGKSKEHNISLLQNLDKLVAENVDVPVLLGTSRKRFMGSICDAAEPDSLAGATCATTVLGVLAGVRVFRVHDVLPNRQALQVCRALHPLRCSTLVSAR